MSLKVFSILGSLVFLLAQGCVATREWVNERVTPLADRLSSAEGDMGRMGGRLSGAEARIAEVDAKANRAHERLLGIEGRLGAVDAKADKALRGLANLRLERRFVLDLKQGANFAFGSSVLTPEAQRHIDGFLSDLKGDLREMRGAIFVIAGHTDSVGSDEYNYELGKKRAESVAKYLITKKRVDPMGVVSVSYGKTAPLADNTTVEGRAKNRRVEILVYREAIAAAAGEPSEPSVSLR